MGNRIFRGRKVDSVSGASAADDTIHNDLAAFSVGGGKRRKERREGRAEE